MQFSSWRRYAYPPVAAVIFSLTVPLAFPLAAWAQDDGITSASASDGGVARIDAIAGDVAIQRGDATDTLAAVPNAPVLGADYVTTGENGRAEVGFDGRSAVRLGENVQIRFTKLDPADRQMQLAAGTIDLRLFGDTDGRSAIDTPSISIVPRTAGSFRVAVDGNGETAVTVRTGRVDIVTPQGAQSLEPGTTLLADGP
ncbi:MAG TPA: FecR domain-containing protein, partial [Candidatus Lustribacter sp.]